MYARAVDEASARLHELRREEWEDLALAAVVLGLALAASAIRPAFAMPLFLGGLTVGFLGMRALWRRWDLVERLASDSDAHVLAEVRAYAAREATLERRHAFAVTIRERPGSDGDEELAALAAELDDEELELDPACAVACMRLLTESPESSPEVLRSGIGRIRAGFRPTPS